MSVPHQDPFQYINTTYKLKARRGARVIYKEGQPEQDDGEIVGVEGVYLLIKMSKTKIALPYHPTWEMKHFE